MRVSFNFTNFTAGEFSQRLDGRTDLQKYFSACSKLENMVPHPHGGAMRRPGFKFVHEVKDSSAKTRIIPFEFSTEQTYVIEVGNLYFRFYKDGGAILEANKTITGITQANPAVVTSNSHGFSDGDWVYIDSIAGMTELNGRTLKVANKTTNTFELTDTNGTNINSSGFTAYSSAGTAARVYTVAHTYTTAQIPDITFAQSADVMYLCHEAHEVAKLTRTGHTAWTLTDVDFEGGPLESANENGGVSKTLNLTPSGTSGSVNITASASLWASTDVGRFVKFNGGFAKITAFTSATVVVATTSTNFTNTDATASWELGAWCDTNGHPRTVSFYEQRLVFAGTTTFPQTLYFSMSGDYENFTAGTNADDAMIYTIASNQVNAIRWMSPMRSLLIGTTGGEFVVRASGTDDAITPTNIQIKRQTNYGSASILPVQAGSATLFVQRAKRKLQELTYQFETDGYVAPDLTLLAEHVTESGIDEMAFQSQPDSIVWCVRGDGQLAGMTYRREENVVGWHRHLLGGFNTTSFDSSDSSVVVVGSENIVISSHGYSTGDEVVYDAAGGTAIAGLTDGTTYYVFVVDSNTVRLAATERQARIGAVINLTAVGTGTQLLKSAAVVESIATIPGDLDQDDVYIIVKRTINGTTKRYVEILGDYDFGDTPVAAFFVDSGLTYSGTSTSSLSGLHHLEGQTVQVLADGAAHADKTVSSGAITLDRACTNAAVGLQFNSVLQTMRLEAGAEDQVAAGKTKRIHGVTARLHETVGAQIGSSATANDIIPFRSSADAMDAPLGLFSGDKNIEFRTGYDNDGFIFVTQTQPLPLTVLSIVARLNTFDAVARTS